jgi:hypothetical protein
MRVLATIVMVAAFGPWAAAPCLALSQLQTDGAAAVDVQDTQPESQVQTEALAPPEHRPRSGPRTRLRVRPAYPYRHYHSVYPVPYRFDYPGPNAKRECVARYVQEFRPSGTVIVPRMNCRWVRG